MRYLTLFGISVVSMILTACISPNMPIFGAQIDYILAFMLAMVMMEKTMTPVFYCSGVAVFMDAFFSKAFGFYILQYLLTGLMIYCFIRKKNIKFGGIIGLAAVSWMIREWIGVILCFFMDAPVGLGLRIIHSILPGAVPQILVSMLVYYLIKKLYCHRFIWPVATFADWS